MCGVVRASAVGDRKTKYRIAHLSASPAIESSQIAITRHARRVTFSGDALMRVAAGLAVS